MELQNFFFNTSDYLLTSKKLGQGSFGTVYIVQNRKDKKKYAIKIFQLEKGFNGDESMQLMRESMILHKLDHPNIVRFIGVSFQSISDPKLFEPSIITEYLPNGSLKEILDQEKKGLSNHKWTPTKKYITLYGIANAMKYLHENKIIHRDLKPENILIDENFYPRVCDFGLSRLLPDTKITDAKISMTTSIGTPMYMAPEILKGDEQYDSSVDIYAYSILVYEIVTGNEPYYELNSTITPIQLTFKVMKGYRPKLDRHITPKMKDLLCRCWNEQPKKRPTFREICGLLLNDFTYLDEEIDEAEFKEFIENVKYNEQINYLVPIGQTWNKESYTHCCLFYKGKTYEVKSSSTFSNNPSHHSPNNLFDGKKEINFTNIWASEKNLDSAFIQISFGNPCKASVLSMRARDRTSYLQGPNSFEIFGVNSNDSLVSLRKFENVSWSPDENKLFTFDNAKEFYTYRIIFYSRSQNYFGLAELNLGEFL